MLIANLGHETGTRDKEARERTGAERRGCDAKARWLMAGLPSQIDDGCDTEY
jgi:hypothetical protein